MEGNYIIFTDVSADIETSFIKENNVHFIPMKYMINSEDKLYTGIYDENILKDFYSAQKKWCWYKNNTNRSSNIQRYMGTNS